MTATSDEAKERQRVRKREYMRKQRAKESHKAYMREYSKLYRNSPHGKDTIVKARRRLYEEKISTSEGLEKLRAEKLAQYYSKTGQANYRRNLLKRYGLTPEAYEAILEIQNGLCAICLRPEAPTKRGLLHVDHCHKSGRVRGLLCSSCNTGIGHLGDDVERVKKAAAYLERFNGSL